jgi:hypothetical protein
MDLVWVISLTTSPFLYHDWGFFYFMITLEQYIEAKKIVAEYEKQNNNIDERDIAFRTLLIPYVEQYGKQLIRDFYDYWREKNASGKKMRFEMEKVFNLEMRISRWERNNKKFAKPSKKDESNMIKLPDGTMIDKKEYSKMFGL